MSGAEPGRWPPPRPDAGRACRSRAWTPPRACWKWRPVSWGRSTCQIRERVSLVQATADRLPFADGDFDIRGHRRSCSSSCHPATGPCGRRDGSSLEAGGWRTPRGSPAARSRPTTPTRTRSSRRGWSRATAVAPTTSRTRRRRPRPSSVAQGSPASPHARARWTTGTRPRASSGSSRASTTRSCSHAGARGARGPRGGPAGTAAWAPARWVRMRLPIAVVTGGARLDPDGHAATARTATRRAGRRPAERPGRSALGVGSAAPSAGASAAPSAGASATTTSSTRGARTGDHVVRLRLDRHALGRLEVRDRDRAVVVDQAPEVVCSASGSLSGRALTLTLDVGCTSVPPDSTAGAAPVPTSWTSTVSSSVIRTANRSTWSGRRVTGWTWMLCTITGLALRRPRRRPPGWTRRRGGGAG